MLACGAIVNQYSPNAHSSYNATGTQKKAQQEQSSTSSTTTTTRIGGRRGKYSTLHNPTLHNNNNTKSSAALNTIFAEYWPDDLVTQGLADGQLLRGQLRLNLTNPSEGYITIPGIRYDLLVKVSVSVVRVSVMRAHMMMGSVHVV